MYIFQLEVLPDRVTLDLSDHAQIDPCASTEVEHLVSEIRNNPILSRWPCVGFDDCTVWVLLIDETHAERLDACTKLLNAFRGATS